MFMLRTIALLSLALAATVAADAAPTNPGALSLASCKIAKTNEEGVAIPGEFVDARCGTFTVPENRTTGRGRMLPLKVVVIPVIGASGSPILNSSAVGVRHGTPTWFRIRATTSRAV